MNFRTNLEGNFVNFNKRGQLILFSFFFFSPFIVGSLHIFFIVSFFFFLLLYFYLIFFPLLFDFFPSFSLTIVCFVTQRAGSFFIDSDFISTLRHTCLSNRCVKISCCS